MKNEEFVFFTFNRARGGNRVFETRRSAVRPRLPIGLLLLAVLIVCLVIPSLAAAVSAQTPTPTPTPAAEANQTKETTTTTGAANKPSPTPAKTPLLDYHDDPLLRVTEVYNGADKTADEQPKPAAERNSAALNDIIVVRVRNLEELVKWSKCKAASQPESCQPTKIVLYINGREISGLEPESGAPKIDMPVDENGKPQEGGELRYHLQRITDSPESGKDNSEHWADLLGLRFDNLSGKLDSNILKDSVKAVDVSVGLAGDYPIKTDVQANKKFNLIRMRGGYWIAAWLVVMVMIIGGLLCLARYTDVLRDRSAVLYNERKPYSLSAFQAAWWFAIVLLSFIFIWLVTGQNDLSPTALILLGIGLGTTLGANIIDVNKRNASNNTQLGTEKLKAMLTDKARLETELGATTRYTAAFVKKDEEYQNKILEIKKIFPNAIGPKEAGFFRDVLSDVNGISFHRFQLFVWTIILGIFFVISALGRLAMPQFSETLLALMGISAGAFLGFKAPENNTLPVPPPDTAAACVIEPNTGVPAGGTEVKITETKFGSVKSVMFGDTAATDVSIDAASSVITATTPKHDAGKVVTVIIEDNEGKKAQTEFTYQNG